ncbi:TIGR00341 family protein [Methyloprofundus sp.]|uniref:TIGR00341 family protein n=1 Tax=Methyloprofundus sp. TaxID=2020875 RepID=UPI003D12DE8E
MTTYVNFALFVYTEKTEVLLEQLQSNAFGTQFNTISYDRLLLNPQASLEGVAHVIMAGDMVETKAIFRFALEYGFSIALIPEKSEKKLIKSFNLPAEADKAIELACRENTQAVDLVLCNDHILLYKATLGWLPLLDASADKSKVRFLIDSFKKSFKLKLLKFCFTTAKGQKITTAASGCILIQQHQGSLVSKFSGNDSTINDGAISMMIFSPISIVVYSKILLRMLTSSSQKNRLPPGIGYIKSSQIDIATEPQLNVTIDDISVTQTPLHCEVLPKAIRLNVGDKQSKDCQKAKDSKESVKIANLPSDKELDQISLKHIPIFAYAAEERFRELFISLRDDAKMSSIYVTLMILSTLLATIGLFQDSTAVVIGAMLLAPLMAPIVSLAMGLLRGNIELLKNAANKIALGIMLALLASALITQLFPYKMITDEMTARLSPSLLDLAVAIVSGVAGAYSKSYKEIIQSLAGVAIAVALVPPLAVAGIGIGRLDINFFLQAFLLFSTNLIGITLAATLTFRFLGYSPVVYAKRGLSIVFVLFMVIAVPLYTSYDQIVEKISFESTFQKKRFFVNGKYIIVQKVKLNRGNEPKIVTAEILMRSTITRKDMLELKKKIQLHFPGKPIIRIKVTYNL